MPTMKEIADALLLASEECLDTMVYLHERGEVFLALNRKKQADNFKELAAKVEQMRCETCAHWDSTPPSTCLRPGNEIDNDIAFIEDCGPNFGCWHWKEKEVNNG